MLTEPVILQTPARRTAVIRLTIPRGQIQVVMGPAIGELMASLQAQGVAPAGPLFSRHLRMDPEVFDFEVGVPVEGLVTPTGRVRPGELPAATVARALYAGPYEGLGDAWGAMDAWVNANGDAPRGDLWECYLTGPESSQDPKTWRTELNRPLA
jgi:effector-binding domain-containing protein